MDEKKHTSDELFSIHCDQFYALGWLPQFAWDLVLDCVTDDIVCLEKISRDEMIWTWLDGEKKRSREWALYVDDAMPSVFLSHPDFTDPFENHMRERLFLSLRRKLFCEIPAHTDWYRAHIRLSPMWARRWNVLWTDSACPVTQGRPVSLTNIIVWESVFDTQRYHVLEGNHRVTQWLANQQVRKSTNVVQTITIIIGRSSAACHWVHRHLPPLYQWNENVYPMIPVYHDRRHTLIKDDDSDDDDPPSSRLLHVSYTLAALFLFATFSTLMHLLHPHL